MSIHYNPEAIVEIRRLQNYHCVPEHGITVEMVCYYANDQRLPQNLVIDMMSYMYGVYEDIAVYGNDHYTRQNGITNMNAFDEAINRLDGEDYTEPQFLSPPPGFDQIPAVELSPILAPTDVVTPPGSIMMLPPSPPPLTRHGVVYGLEHDTGDYSFATPSRSTPDTMEHHSPLM
jgi:hypothetical protein